MEQDGEWLSVGGEDDELGDAAVQGLGGLVGALLQLLVVGGLLHKAQDNLGKVSSRKRVGTLVNFGHLWFARWLVDRRE